MSNYTKTTNFAAKDSLPSGNAAKIVKGTEIDTEFNNIATAIATKKDSSQTITLTGDATGSGTTSIAVTVADDSHNHVISNVDGLQTALDAKQDATSALTTSTSFGGDVSGTYNAIVIADDSHNHTIANVDGLQTALDAKLASSSYTASDVLSKLLTVDGTGTGLDADKVDGFNISTASSGTDPNTIYFRT